MSTSEPPIRVLHVDDERDFGELAREFLERESDRFHVRTATSATEGLTALDAGDVDCVVSDYDMPGRDGLDFLEAVRVEYPDLPFILFTGKGSEEIASEAISAGVSDYLEKTGHTDQYTVLANRISNLVEKYTAEQDRERNRALVEEATDAILVVRPDATITYATPSTEAVLGRTPEELFGTSGFAPIHPDDVESVRATFAELATEEGARRTVEFRYERPDGSWIWLETRGRNLLHSEAVDGIAIYSRDVTARKERIDELEEEKALNEVTLESVADFYWSIDPEGYVTRWSDEDGSATGYTPADAIGRHTSTFHPDEDVPVIQEAIEEIIETGSVTVQADLLTKGGERIPYRFTGTALTDTDGEIRALCGLGRDISTRQRRQRELERYEAIIENTEDGVYVFDQEGYFEFVNERVVDVSGIPAEAWVGEHVSIQADLGTLSSAEISAIENAIEAITNGESEEERVELRPDIPHAVRILELRLTPLRSEDGVQKVIGFSRDITERREAEEAVAARNDRLEAFVNTLSHDLRNPLNVAQGRLDIARERDDDADLDAAASAVDRSLSLIEDILTVARHGQSDPEFEPLDLDQVAHACWRSVGTEAATLSVAANQTFLADRSRLKQILENLIRNAIEHGGEGVTVTVGPTDDGFYVADDGPGIPESDREGVFEMGVSSVEGNTGFGLAIVAEIADAHGWEVEISEGEDGGARFDVRGVQTT